MLNALLARSKVLRDIWLGKWSSACYEKRELGAYVSSSHSQVYIHPGLVRLKSMTCNPQSSQEKRWMIWILTVIVSVASTEGWRQGDCRAEDKAPCIFGSASSEVALAWAHPAGLRWRWQAWKASPHTAEFTGRKWQFVPAHQLLSERQHFLLISNSTRHSLSLQPKQKEMPATPGGRGGRGIPEPQN